MYNIFDSDKKNLRPMKYSPNQFDVVGGQIDFYYDTSPIIESMAPRSDHAETKNSKQDSDMFESLLHQYDEDLNLVEKSPQPQNHVFKVHSKEDQLQIFDSTNNKSQFEIHGYESPPEYANQIGSDSSSQQESQAQSRSNKKKKNNIRQSKTEGKPKLKSCFKNFLPMCKRSLLRLVKGIDRQEKNKTCLNQFNELFHNLEMRQSLGKVFLSNSLLRELQNSRIDPSNRLLFLQKVHYLKKAFTVGKLSHL